MTSLCRVLPVLLIVAALPLHAEIAVTNVNLVLGPYESKPMGLTNTWYSPPDGMVLLIERVCLKATPDFDPPAGILVFMPDKQEAAQEKHFHTIISFTNGQQRCQEFAPPFLVSWRSAIALGFSDTAGPVELFSTDDWVAGGVFVTVKGKLVDMDDLYACVTSAFTDLQVCSANALGTLAVDYAGPVVVTLMGASNLADWVFEDHVRVGRTANDRELSLDIPLTPMPERRFWRAAVRAR